MSRTAEATLQETYRESGYAVVRSLFKSTEIADMAREADRLAARTELIDTDNIRCRWQSHVTTGVCRFDCFDPVIDLSALFEKVARDPRLLDLAGSLYGERAFLFKDKLIWKPPGALGYALHQDYISWPSFPQTFVTAILAIDACDAANGATEVFPGAHKQGLIGPRDGMYHQLTAEQVDLTKGVPLDLAPGDVAIFSGYLPHRSGPNTSDRSRRLLYVSYNAESDGGEQRDRHYAEFKDWLKDRYAEYGKTNIFFR
jgi:ectoine hydroxylase-related dioxygenase (phytanoyl-CoA dioxygenase family)